MGNYSFQNKGTEVEIRLNREVFSDEFISALLARMKLELIIRQEREQVSQEVVDQFVEEVQTSWWNEKGEDYLATFAQ